MGYLLKCLKILICFFTDQFSRFKSWMELQIQEPFFSHSTRALTFVFTEKKWIKFEKRIYFFMKKNCILSFVFKERRKHILKKINCHSFWEVLKLPKLFPYFLTFIGLDQVSPLGHPYPTLTSPTCIRWVELAWSLIQVHYIPLLKVIHIGKWVVWPCKHTYNLGAIIW